MATAKKTAPVVNLNEELAAKRVELIETKRSHAAGELVNPRALGRIRKEIARIQTEMNRKDSTEPVSEGKEVTPEEEKK